jgi:hypothetical protein
MATSPPVVIVREKRGLGCFGGGCLAVILVLLLLAALTGGIGYFTYKKGVSLTSTSPKTVQTFDGGDAVYQGAEQKLTTFNQAVQQDQPGALELTADEINTLIARAPDLAANGVHIFITLTGDKAHAQVSLPTSMLPAGILKDRYVNGEVDFTPAFDSADKSLTLILHSLQIGDETVPESELPMLQSQFIAPAINAACQGSPAIKEMLSRTTEISVHDGKLVVQTQ